MALLHRYSTSATKALPHSNISAKRTQKKRQKVALVLASVLLLFTYDAFLVSSPTNKNGRELLSSTGDNTTDSSSSSSTCAWMPPNGNVPDDIPFFKTIITEYPSDGKPLSVMQLEALTGWTTKDSWEFEKFGMSNHPFIKTNFPHHDGTWGFDDAGDQVILVVQNLRSSLLQFHNIMWDLGFKNTYARVLKFEKNSPAERPPVGHYLSWRDEQVLDEIHWFGLFIDYWMEAGLMRDLKSHEITTPEHWNMLLNPGPYSPKERSYETVVGNTVVQPSYDPHCVDNVSKGCQPVTVISAEHLADPSTGPAEARKLAEAIQGKPGIGDFLVPEDQWECLWNELTVNKAGANYMRRALTRGDAEREYNFSEEMLVAMINEYERLITKYSSDAWYPLEASKLLVKYFNEHLEEVKQELHEVQTGVRVLQHDDFLGPTGRNVMRRKLDKSHHEQHPRHHDGIGFIQSGNLVMEGIEGDDGKEKDYSDFFSNLDKELFMLRRQRQIENAALNHQETAEVSKRLEKYFTDRFELVKQMEKAQNGGVRADS